MKQPTPSGSSDLASLFSHLTASMVATQEALDQQHRIDNKKFTKLCQTQIKHLDEASVRQILTSIAPKQYLMKQQQVELNCQLDFNKGKRISLKANILNAYYLARYSKSSESKGREEKIKLTSNMLPLKPSALEAQAEKPFGTSDSIFI